MYLLPYVNSKFVIQDGSFIKALNFCKNYCNQGKCLQHYETLLQNEQSQFVKCPYGLVSYLEVQNGRKLIFSGLREKSLYVKGNKKFSNELVFNPVLDKNQIMVLVDNGIIENRLKSDYTEKVGSFDSMTHEVKKLNNQIKEYCDSLINLYNEKKDYMTLGTDEYELLFEKVRTLYIISSMINSRYAIYDYDKNPDTLSSGSTFASSIHGKFLKCSKILKNYKKKNIFVNLEGETHKYIDAYPSFEMIPFLLIENAMKYALEETEVDIFFSNKRNSLDVEISSFGPYCSQEEIPHIFEKNFRGKHAKKISDGTGIGLYFVKLICDLHNISISVASDSASVKSVNSVPYSTFAITLHFENVFEQDDM